MGVLAKKTPGMKALNEAHGEVAHTKGGQEKALGKNVEGGARGLLGVRTDAE